MHPILRKYLCSFVLALMASQAVAQNTPQAHNVVPNLINYSGVLKDSTGQPINSITGVTFLIFKDEQGGAPLWLETQNVIPDKTGHYRVALGATKPQGLPTDLFTSGEARWLEVQVQGQAEQPRVFLLSVPYALKAADAETIGGLPASAFVLAAPNSGSQNSPVPSQNTQPQPSVGGSGTQNYLPIWTDNSGDLGNSILYQSSTTAVGIGTTTPAATLDVNGGVISRGVLQLPSTGTANATQGYNSQPLTLQGSSFNSSTAKPIGPLFQWQTEPLGNNTANPSGSLNLLYGSGSGQPSETGLNIASTGLITFAKGQTFPGAGTITGVTAGTGLSGGGTSGNVTLSINTAFANKYYAQLGVANTFTANQTVNGSMTATAFSGNGAALTNVNAALLNGLASNAFSQVTKSNIYQSSPLGSAIPQVLGPVNTATTASGFNSNPQDLAASVYNSGGSAAQSQTFRWQAEPAGNNTTSPSGTLNLLFGANGGTPTETGLAVASNGQITFASGQAFPGTGNGTITGVMAGTDMLGGGTTGVVTLNVDTTKVVTGVVAGTDLTGGGNGGNLTLNLDTTKVPQLNAANTFTGNQTVTGNLSATGVVSGSAFQIGSNLFGFGNINSFNAFMGFGGNSTMTGTYNTASGVQALYSNTSGANNTAVGADALFSNSTGGGNTAVGLNALTLNTTGYQNTATGIDALYYNTTGAANTAGGGFALTSNTTGSDNAAYGYLALSENTTGGNNTAVGFSALNTVQTATDNTAVGAFALLNSQAGYNTAIGSQALNANSGGSGNSAIGYSALGVNNAGSYNAANGYDALGLNTTGSNNVGEGSSALAENSSGSDNVGLGSGALLTNTTGSFNTALGDEAGFPSDFSNITGSSNTFVGYSTGPSTGSLNFATSIGALAQVWQSNTIVLGATNGVNGATSDTRVGIADNTPTNIFTIGQGHGKALSDGWTTYSSRRWKTNIQTLPDALAKVENLRGVSYDLKENGQHEIGVIAEEVGAVVPEVVTFEANGKDARGVDYSRLTALLIEAVKTQQKQIAAQTAQIRALHSQMKQRAVKETALEQRLALVERVGARTERVTAACVASNNVSGQ